MTKRTVRGGIQSLEERYQDGRNIRYIGGQKFVPYSLETRLHRGVNVGESRIDSPGFIEGIHPNYFVFGCTDPDVWNGEGFTPDGLPDGDVSDPLSFANRREDLFCDMEGCIIYDEWTPEDEADLNEMLAEEELRLQIAQEEECEYIQTLKQRKKRRKNRLRASVPTRVNLETAKVTRF